MKTKENRKNGISLIVLVITIIVIIILATAIILTVLNNNPISQANKARYESDRDNMQSIFTNTVVKVMAQNQGSISIKAGTLNEITSGVTSTIGVANYEMENVEDSSKASGTIIFDDKDNTETEYYTGKQLPIYKAGNTVWSVDEEGILKLQVGKKIYDNEQNDGNENKETEKTENKQEIEELKKSYEEISKRLEEIEKNNGIYSNLASDVENLKKRTTMHTISKSASNISIRGDSTAIEALSIKIPENCYADIFAFSDLLKNHSDAYNSIALKRNNQALCVSGKGGTGYTVQDCLSYSVKLNKGDIITVCLYQSTGVTTTVNANIIINYFPI